MKLKVRRLSVVGVALILVAIWLMVNPESYDTVFVASGNEGTDYAVEADGESMDGKEEAGREVKINAPLATEVLAKLEVKGRAPKTDYSREQFYNGWPTVEGCSLRQKIIKREFGESAVLDGCNVVAGEYEEPYTGEHKVFTGRSQISSGVQIDHVVALSDAWQKGAQNLTAEERYSIATDPLNLLAVDGPANQQKSDGDAATWLPPNKKFRCQYVARQVSVKYKYGLWVTEAESQAIDRVLENCPQELAVGVSL
ncbi:HNH endonuclease [Candidatus Saccharibacteria bacterium]|nr:HNH endonuclease [Candidatus Saccharibacteria bacterium]